MAWQVSKRVWDHAKNVKLNYKVMLLALADKADENGICWPKYDTSYKTLGEMVGGLDRRSAMRLIDNLVESGHVIKRETVGRGNSNVFVVISGLSEVEKQRVIALISDNPVTITNEERKEKQEEMVTTFTSNGDNPVTNYGLNGDNPVTQSNISPSIPSLSSKDDSGEPPTQPAFSEEFTLLPDTPETRLLFEKVNVNRNANGRSSAKKFKSLEQKKKCLKAAVRLGFEKFTEGIDAGLETGLPAELAPLVNWIAKYTGNGPTSDKNGTRREPARASPKLSAPIDQDRLEKLQKGII